MRFESPWALLLLLVIPVAIYLQLRREARPALRFSTTEQAALLKASLRRRFLHLPMVLRAVALVLLCIALARPQQGQEMVRDINKGVAIEMVVDRSGSMGAEMNFGGEKLNRLEVCKKVFEEFITGKRQEKGLNFSQKLAGRPSDLIGMITFARYPDTICPLTLAHEALAGFIDSVKLVQRRNEDGTAIGDALALAAARLKTAEETIARQSPDKAKDYKIKSKIIILLTDGRSNCGKRSPEEAADMAAQWGIKIYTIGIGGGEAYSTVQTPFGEYKMPVQQDMDEATLKMLANKTGGIFRVAQDGDSLRSIYKEIDRLEKSEVESLRYHNYHEKFLPFALAALLLVVVEIGLSSTVFRRIP
jgi:Ca-activated chloride channel family protein